MYKTSVKNFSRLILQKDFINLSLQFQLKIIIAEIIIRYELHQTETVEKKIKEVRKNYKKILKENKRDEKILQILQELIYCNNIRSNKKIKDKIKTIQSISTDDSAENLDIINYNEWLASLNIN